MGRTANLKFNIKKDVYLLSLAIFLTLVFEPGQPTVAQNPSKSGPPQKDQKPAAKQISPEALAAEAQIRLAQSRLEAIAGRAKDLPDGIVKVRVLAKVADALWDSNEVRA